MWKGALLAAVLCGRDKESAAGEKDVADAGHGVMERFS
jgi:hypothetical protein